MGTRDHDLWPVSARPTGLNVTARAEDGRTRSFVFVQMDVLALLAVFAETAAGDGGSLFAIVYVGFMAVQASMWAIRASWHLARPRLAADNRGVRKGVTRVAGLILLLIALPILLIGLGFLGYAIAFNDPCAPNAPVCRGPGPGGFILAALVLAIGVLHLVAGVGIWRRRRWAHVVGLVISVGGLLFALYLGQSAFTPISFADLDPTRPGLEPMSNNNLIAAVASALAYGFVAVVLLIGIRRGFRPTEPGGIATRHTD